ncbi:MAG: NYN domain-containing protein [Ruminococcaceae bacterium]|nr:NYN domain-containing protein [Oscillospiraceae bacterium]
MNYYYIDFENVKTAGLKGVDALPSSDTVKIFAKGGSDQMKFNDIKTLMAAKATVTIEDVVTGTKNALDFQLLTDLMIDCVKRAGMSPAPKFVIISADHGYDPAITQMKKRGVNNVYRATTIKDAENGNFAGKEPKQPRAKKTTDDKKEEKPRKKAAPKADTPASDAPVASAAKTEPSKTQKPEQKQPSSRPSRRRVHSRTINKDDKNATETPKK